MPLGVIEPAAQGSGIRAAEGASRGRLSRLAVLSLALYLTSLSVDAARKVTGLPVTALGLTYVITALIYVLAFPRGARPGATREGHRILPLWLFLLSLWCLTVALAERIPTEVALLGWASYVFFVPLAYAGAAIAADGTLAVKALRLVARCGGVIGTTTVIGAILGDSAPALLRPIIPAVGFHSSTRGNVYLSPSVFATAEVASEQLLLAWFAWVALAHLDGGRLRRMPSVLCGVFIITGLVFAARRADLYVAAAGTGAVLLLGYFRRPASAGRIAPDARNPARARLALSVIVVTAGSAGLAFLLGDSTLTAFLVSGSAGDRISLIFSLTNSGSLLGQGPGTATQGIALFGSTKVGADPANAVSTYILNGRIFTAVEGGLGKTWLELGTIGVVLYGAVFLSAMSPAIRSLLRLDGVGAALTALACTMGVIFLKGHQSLDNPLIQPLFWLAVGGIWGRVQLSQRQPAACRPYQQ